MHNNKFNEQAKNNNKLHKWFSIFGLVHSANLPLILHKVKTRKLPFTNFPHFTLHSAEKLRKLPVADFPHFTIAPVWCYSAFQCTSSEADLI